MPKKSIDEKLDDLALSVAKGFAEVSVEMREMKQDLSGRLDKVETRLDSVEITVEVIRTKVDKIDQRLENTERTMASHETRLDALEARV